ncbi:MAG: hypothetical protein IPJ52_12420 [Rhodocyclaceae bacterium]|nr:hypothetical protein [Rhodocyclaceae bacterium]
MLYRSGEHVVELDGDVAKPFIKDGSLDDALAAVKYALGDGGAKLVKHASPVAQEESPPEINPRTTRPAGACAGSSGAFLGALRKRTSSAASLPASCWPSPPLPTPAPSPTMPKTRSSTR